MQRSLFGDSSQDERAKDDWVDDEFDEEEEWEERRAKLFGFDPTEACVVDEMIGLVRSLLKRKDITPEQIYHLAKMLFALERMPLPTPGVDVVFALGYKSGGELYGQSLGVSERAFVLDSAAYTQAGPGGDASSEIIFETEVGGSSFFENWFALAGWIASIKEIVADEGADLEVWSSGDDDKIDWEDVPDEDPWQLIY